MKQVEASSVKRELVSKTAVLYVLMIASALASYVGLFIAVRYVGEIEYGIVAFALSFEGILLFVTDMGLARSHTKKVSEGSDLAKCVSVFLLLRLLLSAIYAVAVLVSVFIWDELFNAQGLEDETRNVLLILLAYNVLVSIRWVFVYTSYAKREVLRAQGVLVAEGVVRAFVIVLVVFLAPSATGLAYAFTFSAGVSCLYAVLLARRDSEGVSPLRVDRTLLREYIAFAMPIAFSIVGATIALYLDKVIIQWSSTAIETGSYFASQRLLAIYISLGSAVSVILFPAISEINGRDKASHMVGPMTSAALRYLIFIVVPLMFFMVLFSEEIIIVLLSPDMAFASDAFSILAITYGLYVLTTPFFSHALGLGYSSQYATYNIVYCVIVIFLDALLIPNEMFGIRLAGMGIVGAALALLVAQVVNSAMFYLHARRLAGFSAPRGVAATVFASAVSCVVALLVASLLSVNLLLEFVIIFPVYIVCTVLVLILLKTLRFSELKEMVNLVLPRGAR